MMPSIRLHTWMMVLAVTAPIPACPAVERPAQPDDSNDSDSDTNDSTVTGDAPTSNTGGVSGQSSSQGSDDSNADSSGGGMMEPDIEQACELNCALLTRCFPEDPQPPSCVTSCVEAATQSGIEGCEAATIERYICLATLTCEELLNGFRACADIAQQSAEACSDGCVIGGGSDNGECSYGFYCPELVQEMRCDAETCICLENRIEVGSCDAMGICDADSQSLREYPEICCGFVYERNHPRT